MSELRQRHGGSHTSTQLVRAGDSVRPKLSLYLGGTACWKNDGIEDIIRSSVVPRNKHVPLSITDKARKAKEALEEDPYSLDKLIDLGYIYASEVQYEKAANVLIRGWKRAGELKEPSDRFSFLLKLCELSFRSQQYKQAHAVLMDIEKPDDYYEKKAYQLLSCHVHAEIGDGFSALSVFSKAIDGEAFEDAIKIWAACALRLQKVGAHPAAKEAMLEKARKEQNHYMEHSVDSRIQTIEMFATMNDKKSKGLQNLFDLENGIQKWMIAVGVMLLCLPFIWCLHWLEGRNLRNMNML